MGLFKSLFSSQELKKEPIGTAALIVGGIAAVLGVLIAGWTLFDQLRGPSIGIVLGPEVLFIGYDHLGVECTFINTGSRPAVISGLTAHTEDGDRMRAYWLSVGDDTFKLVGGHQERVGESSYQDFRPIVVQGRSHATARVWFASQRPLVPDQKVSKRHIAVHAFYGPTESAAVAMLRFNTSEGVFACLRQSEQEWNQRTPGRPYIECPAEAEGWNDVFDARPRPASVDVESQPRHAPAAASDSSGRNRDSADPMPEEK